MVEAEPSNRFRSPGWATPLRFASLPTRIIVSVFSTAVVTGIAVTLISTSSTETFLRSKIDARFPEMLRSVSLDLDQWYARREIDIATFASSDTLAASLQRRDQASADEARRYLAYVREGFPLYRTLFVLGPQAELVVAEGAELPLPVSIRRQLSTIDRTTASRAFLAQSLMLQVVSTPLERDGARIGTLHAAIAVDSLADLLGAPEAEAGTGIYVVGPDTLVLARSPGARARARFERALPAPRMSPFVEDYTTANGDHLVGSALHFERFDWTLVVEQDYDQAFLPVVSAMGKVLAINLGIVVAFGALAFVIARSITRPIRALSDSADRIAQGETDVEIPRVEGGDEIGVLSRALHEMVDRLRRNQVELQRKQEQIARANAELTRANEDLHRNNEMLEQLSFTDGLTQLHNHRYFQDRLRIEAKRSDRSHEPLALLLVDIDDFKSLNDRHGHAVGDEVLRRVARILNNSVRETDLPARYGGEEFAVLAPRTTEKGAVALAQKLRETVAQARFRGVELAEDAELSVTVSVGVSLYDGDVKRFFNEADRALYQAKGDGKDCVVLFGAG